MNELNYASLEASKKLVDNGIVLETDYYWASIDMEHWDLCFIPHKSGFKEYPAPSMAEVLRELPLKESPSGYAHLVFYLTGISWVTNTDESFFAFGSKFNPTDALIDLLVWLKGEGK